MPKGKKAKKKVKKTNRAGQGSYFRNHRSQFIIGGMVTFLVAVLAAAYIYIIRNYTVTTVYVEGSVHYTNEEIIEMVMEGRYGSNSLLLAARYKDKSIVGVPFVEKMDVSVLDPHTIRIEVYEKALAGYVEYLERYMYFDKDGIMVGSVTERREDIPEVTGISYERIVYNEKMDTPRDELFQLVLNVTQLIRQYELSIRRIDFNSGMEITMYTGSVRILLGRREQYDEPLSALSGILKEAEGMKGTFHMEEYSRKNDKVVFVTEED